MGIVRQSLGWLLVAAVGVLLLGATVRGEDRPSLGGEDLIRSLVGKAVQHQLGRRLLTGNDNDKDDGQYKDGSKYSPPPYGKQEYNGCPYAVKVAFQVLDLQPLLSSYSSGSSAQNGGGYSTEGVDGLLSCLDLTQVYEIKMVFDIEALNITSIQLPAYPTAPSPPYYVTPPYVSKPPVPSKTPYFSPPPYASAPPPPSETPYASAPPPPSETPYASAPPSPSETPYASAPPSPYASAQPYASAPPAGYPYYNGGPGGTILPPVVVYGP